MDKEDIRNVFKNLVTNIFMPEFMYVDMKFSFQTVYHKTPYSYCCCVCAYDHEFMGYLSETGEVNDAIYDKIVQNISDGKCPHVDKVSAAFVRETNIYGIHIAAAIGTERAVRDHLNNYTDNNRFSGIFRVDPYLLAVLKNTVVTTDIFCEFRDENLSIAPPLSVTLPKKAENGTNSYYCERMSVIEICFQKRNFGFLNSAIYPRTYPLGIHIARGLAIMFRSQLLDVEGPMLDYMSRVFAQNALWSRMDWTFSAIVAVVYDQPETLETILSYINRDPRSSSIDTEHLQFNLGETCFVLQRKSCERILSKFDVLTPTKMSDYDQIRRLINLLHSFYDDFSDEIQVALKNIRGIQEVINCAEVDPCQIRRRAYGTSHLSGYLCSYYEFIDTRVMETMIELGADIDNTIGNGLTPLTFFLSSVVEWPRLWYYRNIREAVELLLYQNPNIIINEKAVKLALKSDLVLMGHNADAKGDIFYGNFIMDANEHAVFGHNKTSNFALNFLAPLLIESGFPVSRETVVDFVDKNLHAAEKDFLKKNIETPRKLNLKWTCRNIIRKHFSGRQLHAFVAESSLPEMIKDYLLLKDILKCYDSHSHLSKIPEILTRSWEF